jgi:long-subunit fatty acid transport protein
MQPRNNNRTVSQHALVRYGILSAAVLFHMAAHADIFHYNNSILGDRAIGLGGAYSGVADDASGIIYNPGGLGFAGGTDISGSANVYYVKKTTYKNILEGQDFTESSEGFVPSFFGGIQKLDSIAKGLVAGFAVYSPDNEIRDQNDIITGTAVRAFHRNVKLSASTLRLNFAAAMRLSPKFSLGATVGFMNLSELVQEYQLSALAWNADYIRDTAGRFYSIDKTKVDETFGKLSYIRSISTNNKLTARGLEGGLGSQIVIGSSVVAGLSARTTFLLSENLAVEGDQITFFRYDNGRAISRDLLRSTDCPDVVTKAGRSCETDLSKFDEVSTRSAYPLPGYSALRSTNKSPLGGWPVTVRGGVAWFASPRILWTFDVEHNTEAKDGLLKQNWRDAVTNYSSGTEIYATPSVPVRLGVFTNFDARPKLVAGTANQPEHIDYYGASAYLGWAEPSSQIGGGVVYQTGKGKANKRSDDVTQQEIKASSLSLAFSAAHQL